ncbi:hypothetical protein D3C85_1686200 [compost metagenome]
MEIFDAAVSICCTSPGDNEMVAAPMFSCKRCNFVVPGIGTIQGFCASNQARAICAGVASLSIAIDLNKSTKA